MEYTQACCPLRGCSVKASLWTLIKFTKHPAFSQAVTEANLLAGVPLGYARPHRGEGQGYVQVVEHLGAAGHSHPDLSSCP